MKITYFVHGTTTDNEEGLMTGWNPGELSPLGIKQAEELGSIVPYEDYDVLFCSDLKRAVDSAELGFEGKVSIVIDSRLRECNYGDLNGSKDEDKEKHIETPFPDGESYLDVEERIKDFLKETKEKGYTHIAVLAHQAPQLAIEVICLRKSWKEAFETDWRRRKEWKAGWEYEY